MVEALLGAIAGALLTHLSNRALGAAQRGRIEGLEARDAVTRLTEAVEHIAHQLEVLHEDIKADRRETFSRLGSLEQRVSAIESRC